MRSSTQPTQREERKRRARTSDVCGCCVGCYPNGLISLLIAQVLLLLGFLLTVTSMLDCIFVEADVYTSESILTAPDNNTLWDVNDRTGFGFISYQDPSGKCLIETWASENEQDSDGNIQEAEDQVEDYMNWLGEDWRRATYFLGFAVGASFILFVWVICMMCIAHNRPLRLLAAAIPLLGIMPLQLASLSVLDSDFCVERNCTLGRSGMASVCAGAMYFAGSVALCFMKRYSSNRDEEEDIEQPAEQRQSSHQPAEVEMVEVAVEDASFVIEDDRARRSSGQMDEAIVGDGMAEAQEIKPDMVFLHDDGEAQEPSPVAGYPSSPHVSAAASAAVASPAAAATEDEIPTVTDVQILDDGSKTKVAP